MNKAILLVALLTLFAVKPARPTSVGSVTLENLTRYSDAIFIGQVEETLLVEQLEAGEEGEFFTPIDYPTSLKIARVRVEQALKGVVEDSRLYFLAMGTWTCDTSTAEVGERALYFLDSSDWTSKLAASTRANLKQQTSGGPVYKLAHSGRGRVPLRKVERVEYATGWGGVRLPSQLPLIAGLQPEYPFVRSVHLGAITKQLTGYVVAHQPYFELTHRQLGSPARGWNFRIWGDGYGILQVDGEPGWDIVEPASAEVMAGLSARLKATQNSNGPITIGPVDSEGPRRTLLVRGKDQALHVKIGPVDSGLAQDGTIKANVAAILNLWSALRAVFGQTCMLDAREADRRWIESS